MTAIYDQRAKPLIEKRKAAEADFAAAVSAAAAMPKGAGSHVLTALMKEVERTQGIKRAIIDEMEAFRIG